jgi:hypothetical protein
MLDEGRLINGPIFDDVHDLYNIGVVRYQVRLMRQMCTTASTTTSSAPSMFVPNTTPTPHWWPLLPLFLSKKYNMLYNIIAFNPSLMSYAGHIHTC